MPRIDGDLAAMIETLSRLGPSDVRTVLDALDPASRRHAATLLDKRKLMPDPGHAGDLAGMGLSAWLITRIEAADALKPETRNALVNCASRLPDRGGAADGLDAVSGSLLRRICARARSWGAAR